MNTPDDFDLPAASFLPSTSCLPPAVMVLGTASHAGKSLLTAALCRAFARRGLNVAPFKAQNMALNSAVTPDGLEIGRAQAMQAQACGLLPDARMNPVLLKPSSDTGSQVVVLGKPVGHYSARDYEKLKPSLFQTVRQTYAELAVGRDIMLLEGAGSPAEINLKATDIVNTRMARAAGARAVLAGDIDRGGVFAALVGTMELLEPWERDLIAGFVINKFRGDASLLAPALDAVTLRTGKPFLGVVPWLESLGLPEEDSLGLRSGQSLHLGAVGPIAPDELDIAILDLARVGNFSDVDPLIGEPGVRTHLVRRPEDLGRPDLIIIPGSKSTVADLRLLRQQGMADAVTALAGQPGGPDVLGICGGLQMLGLSIEDPLGLEESPGHVEPGLGLLPLVTVMAKEKTLCVTPAHDRLLALPLRGYEVHHGVSHITDCASAVQLQKPVHGPLGEMMPWMEDKSGKTLGWAVCPPEPSGRLWCTYAHGLFDDDAYRSAFLNNLRKRRNKPERGASHYSLEPSLDRLADAVEEHMDLDALTKGWF